MIKKILVSFFVLFSLFYFSNLVFSQSSTTLPLENDQNIFFPTVWVDNFNIDNKVYIKGSVVKGSFDLINREGYNIPDLKYTISLGSDYNKLSMSPKRVYGIKTFDKLFLKAHETKKVEFEYNLSSSYSGEDFGIQLKTFTSSGINLGYYNDLIKIEGNSSYLTIKDAYLSDGKNNFPLQRGPSIRDNNIINLKSYINNKNKVDISAKPEIKLYDRTFTGKLLNTFDFDLINIKASSTKEFILELNKLTSNPGVYEGIFSLLDSNNNSISEEIFFRYIVYGNIVDIHNIILDKETVRKGETFFADIYYTGAPFDVTNNDIPKQKPMLTKIIFSNQKGEKVGEYSDLIDYSKNSNIKIPIKSLIDTGFISVDLKVFDENNKVISSYNNNLINNPVEKKSYFYLVYYILSLVVLLLIIYRVFNRIKKNK